MTDQGAGIGHFDVAIIGGGLSGLLHADALRDVADQGLRVVIIDPDPDALSRKTFCSWRRKSDPPHRYSGLVSHRWEKFRFTSSSGDVTAGSFGDYRYERISGESLLRDIRERITDDTRFRRLDSAVMRVCEPREDSTGNGCALLELDSGERLSAARVLGSPAAATAPVLQYFVGVEIETPEDRFDPDVVDLMDFRLPQQGDARFVYILPFSSRSALVEFTVFSASRMPDAECEAILLEYLSSVLKLGSYVISNRESGTIPMSVEMEPVFPPIFRGSVVEVIGAAAGRVKASTGYSFLRNVEECSSSSVASWSRFRFRIYDSLLLGVVRGNGGVVSTIFHRLFRDSPPSVVFAFLDEKSHFIDELRIFWSLPWRPFLVQLVVQYPFIFAVAATAILEGALGPEAGLLVPVLGLLTSGIGHGSLDHLMHHGAVVGASFYLRYLGRMAAFLVAWFVAPLPALGFFLIQSADHFGETNWVRPLRHSRNHGLVRVLAWVWGLFAALFGVLFHWSDSLPLIELIVGGQSPLEMISVEAARAASFGLFVCGASAALVLDRYEERATRQSNLGALATLVFGASLMVLPLLAGFLCFFAFWHAWDTMRIQRMRQGWSSSEYWRRALPFTVVSVMALLGSWLLLGDSADEALKWKILFVALGALTAAHAPVMKRFLLFSRSDGT